ncbi:MAG: hypothetical protein QNK37_05080 [Acidobacteriota bacterium]|nr:hypothetical protein [Acidobacteriota bacterium]
MILILFMLGQGVDIWSGLKALAVISSIIGVPITILLSRRKKSEPKPGWPIILDADSRYSCNSPGLESLKFPSGTLKDEFLFLQCYFQRADNHIDVFRVWTNLTTCQSKRVRAFCYVLLADYLIRHKRYHQSLAWLVEAEKLLGHEEIIQAMRNHASEQLLEQSLNSGC